MPIAYQLDDTVYCPTCWDDVEPEEGEGAPEPDNTIVWVSDWYDEWNLSEYQTLECDLCYRTLDEYEPEPDEDDDYCECEDCQDTSASPQPITRNLAAYMAAFIREATPRVAESVGA